MNIDFITPPASLRSHGSRPRPTRHTDLINSFGVKQNVTGLTHRLNHTLDLIISYGTDLTDIDIVPQSDDVTDHFLISCMLHITDIKYMFIALSSRQNYCSSH